MNQPKDFVAADGTAYLMVPTEYLVDNTRLDFDLYLFDDPAKPEPVLYRSRDLEFEDSSRRRLLDATNQHLCVSADSAPDYYRYIEDNLDAILADPKVSARDKSAALYTCAQNAVHEILDNPEASNVVERSERLVRHSVEFAFSEENAFEYFLDVAAFDYAVYTHSVNVFMYSVNLARACGQTDLDFIFRFGTGALLHDIGKSKLDPSVLHSPDRLTDEQWGQMRQHSAWGWEMLKNNGVTDEVVLNVTRLHHEKLNGQGYPDGLAADDIPDYVRIITVCDIFDALTTRRSYKDALSSFDALQLMREEMAGEVDAGIFGTFVKMMLGSGS